MSKPRVEKSREILEYIIPTKKVRVYRNLHKKTYSVKQGSLVRCHADQVTLRDCQFIVSKAGQRRVRDERRKNVHAFIEGYVVDTSEADKIVDGTLSDKEVMDGQTRWGKAYYNPYTCDTFINEHDGSPIEQSDYVDMHIGMPVMTFTNSEWGNAQSWEEWEAQWMQFVEEQKSMEKSNG